MKQFSKGRRPIYNLADIIRWNFCANMENWNEKSIAKRYYNESSAPKNQYENKTSNPILDFDCLNRIVDENFDHTVDEETLSIHLRLGDLFNQLENTIPNIYSYVDIINKYNIKDKCNKCDLFFGNHVNENEYLSFEYIDKLKVLLEDLGFYTNIVSGEVDEDFVKLSRSKYYIPSIRGFSWLSASINPNNVFWDLQEPPIFSWNQSRKGRYINSVKSLMSGINYQKKHKK